MLDLDKSDQAYLDLLELADYLAWRENDDLADRFLSAAEATFDFLAECPHASAPREYGRASLRG